MPSRPRMNRLPSLDPWFLFAVFLLANSLIAFGHFPWAIRGGILLAGILLPAAVDLFRTRTSRLPVTQDRKSLPPIPGWAWTLVGGMALFSRLYRVDTLSVWPGYEEGANGYAALELFQKWDWGLFHGSSEAPRGYVWGLSLFFKLMGPSLAALWLYPALISLATVPLAYLAARRFFPGASAFLAASLLGLGFWPAYLGRYSGQNVLIPFWECGTLLALGWYWNAPRTKDRGKAALLGLLMGLGFYTHISWAAVAAPIALAVAAKARREKNLRVLIFFLMPLFLVLSPLVLSALAGTYGSYVGSLWAFSQPLPFQEQLQVSLSYLSQLFWGSEDPAHSYRPVWGGLLNPVLGALCFLGILRALKDRGLPRNAWLLTALFLGLAPSLVTKSMEPFRMVPALVVLFLLCFLGLERLMTSLKPHRAWVAAGSILLLSFCLDLYHLAGPYQKICRTLSLWHPYMKGPEFYRAYQVLEDKAASGGPGMVFSDLIPGFGDQTLKLADYRFNVLEHREGSGERPSWAAVLTNANFKPFLARRFPDGTAYYLSKDLPRQNGGLMLWVMPMEGREETLAQWKKASAALKPYLDDCIGYSGGRSFQAVADKLMDAYAAFQGDPFLESCFWEKMADNGWRIPAQDNRAFIQDLEWGVNRGYPAAHLYHAMGLFLWKDGRNREARRAFQRAQAAPLDLTNSSELMRGLP